jgi:hypothetical protein
MRWKFCLLILAACIGCGSGKERYRVSGKVTYAGQPVPVGRILFEPDRAKGNSGPQGFATIAKGEYDTALSGAKGSIGGPMLVKIDAFDGVPQGENSPPLGTPLFPSTFTQAIELPSGDSTHDFEIPRVGTGAAIAK